MAQRAIARLIYRLAKASSDTTMGLDDICAYYSYAQLRMCWVCEKAQCVSDKIVPWKKAKI